MEFSSNDVQGVLKNLVEKEYPQGFKEALLKVQEKRKYTGKSFLDLSEEEFYELFEGNSVFSKKAVGIKIDIRQAMQSKILLISNYFISFYL